MEFRTDITWSQLSAAEKSQRRWAAFLQPSVQFLSDGAGDEYLTRATRLRKAILLEGNPDRVPACALAGFYPSFRAGMTPYDAMYDYERAAEAWLDCNRDLQPDSMVGPIFAALPGPAFDLLEVRSFHWPGHGVPKHAGFQYNEQEWMRPDEYDLLIDDPTDFLLHVYMPRTIAGLEGFGSLFAPLDMVEMGTFPAYLLRWGLPEVSASVQRLLAAGQECNRWAATLFPAMSRLVAEGFPAPIGSMTLAPFDFIGDTLRGTRGILMDMYRQPDALLEACDKMANVLIKWVTRRATLETPPLVFIPLHKGADGFMSLDQFKTFYWPSLRKVIAGLVDDGFVPYPFAEGAYGSRLEVIRDLPVGRTVWHFDRTDMREAKKALGGIACIQGNVPLSLLRLGTASEVTAHCRDLIEAVAPGGGFILDMGAGADDGEDANMRAMIQAAKDFGTY
ncbi:MAG: hypothetical protein M1274_02370 [Actinobacteria bacterium]|nr:hypothetical protein [Actinomycetota bacterium]